MSDYNRLVPGTVSLMLDYMRAFSILFRERAIQIAEKSSELLGVDVSRSLAADIHEVGSLLEAGKVKGVFWKTDLWQAAIKDAESVFIGERVIDSDLPHTPEFWFFETDLHICPMADAPQWVHETGIGTHSTFLHTKRNANVAGFVHYTILMPERLPERYTFKDTLPVVVPQGARLGQQITDQAEACFVAGRRFMQLPIVVPGSDKLPRPIRRRYEREGRVLPEVRVVTLRRKHHEQLTESHSVDWQCQWLVSGHWRRANRRMKEQRPVYVSPYIKGPDDKPFRQPRHTVFAVKR